jgi:hypothetical protein
MHILQVSTPTPNTTGLHWVLHMGTPHGLRVLVDAAPRVGWWDSDGDIYSWNSWIPYFTRWYSWITVVRMGNIYIYPQHTFFWCFFCFFWCFLLTSEVWPINHWFLQRQFDLHPLTTSTPRPLGVVTSLLWRHCRPVKQNTSGQRSYSGCLQGYPEYHGGSWAI